MLSLRQSSLQYAFVLAGVFALAIVHPQARAQSVTRTIKGVPDLPRFGCVYHEQVTSINALATGDVDGDGLIDVTFATKRGVQCQLSIDRIEYSAPQTVDVGFNPTAVVMHDFNKDGFADVLVAGEGNPGALCLGASSGVLAAPISVNIGSGATDIVVADVDGDGNADLCISNGPGFVVAIVRGLGDGSFLPPVIVDFPGKPNKLLAEDLDADGDQDLLVASPTQQRLHLYINDGQGGFALGTFVTTANSSNGTIKFALGSLDDDALPDLAVVSDNPRELVLQRNMGDGTFVVTSTFPLPSSVNDLRMHHTDADADPDVIVQISGGRLLVLDNLGDGTVEQREILVTLFIPEAIALADLEATQAPDLIVFDTNGWAVLQNHDDGRFTPTSVLPVANRSSPMSVIDADGDDLADVVMINTTSHRIEILRNVTVTGDESVQSIPVGDTPLSVAVGDVTGDGHDDILAVTDYDRTFEVIHSDGQGGFVHAATHTIVPANSGRPGMIAIGDIDNDGDLDAIIGDGSKNTVYLYINAGAGVFYGPGEFSIDDTQAAVGIRAVGLVDLNDDGLLDLVAAVRLDPSVRIIMNYGSLSFGPLIKRTIGNANPTAMALADLDGDNDQELIIADDRNDAALIVWNDGDTLLTRRDSLPVTYRCNGVAVGDIDEDGRPDIVVPCTSGYAVSVLRNSASGAWSPQIAHLTTGGPAGIVLADFNSDGRLDIGVGITVDDERFLSILPNQGPRTPKARCPADIDGTATVDAADFMILAGNFGAEVLAGTASDLNGDGIVNAADFVILAAAFGSACP